MPTLTIKQGITVKRKWTFLDANNAPYDITGASITLTIREDYGNSAVVLTASVGSMIVITDPTHGIAWLTIPASVTKALPYKAPKTWVFDVICTLADGTAIDIDGDQVDFIPSTIR